MKTFTTLTDIRQIMKMHSDNATLENISKKLHVDPIEIQRIIDIKFPKKKVKKKEKSTE